MLAHSLELKALLDWLDVPMFPLTKIGVDVVFLTSCLDLRAAASYKLLLVSTDTWFCEMLRGGWNYFLFLSTLHIALLQRAQVDPVNS